MGMRPMKAHDMEALARTGTVAQRFVVANRPDCSPAALKILRRDGDPRVRAAARKTHRRPLARRNDDRNSEVATVCGRTKGA